MRLTGPELKTLRDHMVRLLSMSDLEMLVSFLDHDLESIAGANADKTKAAFRVLIAANNEGWLTELLTGFRDERPDDPALKAFTESLLAAPGAVPPDPYNACYPDSRPCVNRASLRSTLRSLVAGQARILIVRGESRTGKSHTANLIKALSRNVGFEVIAVDLVRYAAAGDVTPPDIGRALADQMGLTGAPALGNEQLSRWTLSYFDWLVGQMRNRAETFWVVIDGFQSISVSQAVNDFVDELCARINGTLLTMRAVLISYERELSSDIDPILSTDVTGAITVDDLTRFFVQFYRDHKPQVTEIDTKASTHASDVAQVMNNTPTPIAEMGRELLARCRKILQENP